MLHPPILPAAFMPETLYVCRLRCRQHYEKGLLSEHIPVFMTVGGLAGGNARYPPPRCINSRSIKSALLRRSFRRRVGDYTTLNRMEPYITWLHATPNWLRRSSPPRLILT